MMEIGEVFVSNMKRQLLFRLRAGLIANVLQEVLVWDWKWFVIVLVSKLGWIVAAVDAEFWPRRDLFRLALFWVLAAL